MAQPSLPYDIKYKIERLEAAVRELNRKRDRRPPNLRDLQDVNGWGAETGSVPMYDATIGRYKPTLIPGTAGIPGAGGFFAYRSTNQSFTANNFDNIVFDTEVNDADNAYNTSTGYWTVPATAWYYVAAGVDYLTVADQERMILEFWCSTSGDRRMMDTYAGKAAGEHLHSISAPMILVTGEQVGVGCLRSLTQNIGPGQSLTWFSAVNLDGVRGLP